MSEQVIPFENLPPGFGDQVEHPPAVPAAPRPAATILLMRDGRSGLEVLLLRRARNSGFVPGAYVFPGGRVDQGDAEPALIERTDGLRPEDAAARLGAVSGAVPPIAYYLAVVREAFEETGLLICRSGEGLLRPGSGPAAQGDPVDWIRGGMDDFRALQERNDLLGESVTFADVLDRLGCRIAGDALLYIAHWITPVAEPRRYDTRFFAAAVPPGREVSLDAREMTDSVWLTPSLALERNVQGSLPMVFPTLKTLEDFRYFRTTSEALESLRSRPVHPILPRLVRTPTGIGIEMP